jgi:cell division protein ZapB
MEELNSLDQKIQQLVQLCQRLRKDNGALRQQLASAQNENKRLTDKIGAAQSRLEALLEQVPEGQE